MIKRLLRRFCSFDEQDSFADAEPWQMDIIARVQPYTMTGFSRTLSTINAVEYVASHNVAGAIVECGVWRGGNMMAAALTLEHFRATRPLYLFDTFTGMTPPEDADRDLTGISAEVVHSRLRKTKSNASWCEASIELVQSNMASTGYPADLIHLIKGPVESTLPSNAPEAVAVLRLDTDWYASTLHELVHLYPRVSSGGVVIIDDYGHWHGARRAVDEYLRSQNIRCLLHRIDYTGREFVKP
jgi:hypothetical protein